MYDIFYISKTKIDENDWLNFKKRYPLSQKIENVTSYSDVEIKAFTKMFWVVWDDLILLDNFDLNSYRATQWDDMYIHVFKNSEYYDGICLFSKKNKISNKEFENRFYINKKEIDLKISIPKKFEVFNLSSYKDYETALENSKTDMFWGIWNDVEIIDRSKLDLYFSHHSFHDRSNNHVFKNLCNNETSYFHGVVLFSKKFKVSKKEIEKRYLLEKKEHDIVLSKSKHKYPRYQIDTYDTYLEILKNEKSEMFWGIWKDIEIIDQEPFDLFYDPYNFTYEFDRDINHVFKNIFRKEETYTNGLVLFSKNKSITKKEFDHRFLIEKKEHNKVCSKMKPYDIVFISYNEINADENYEKIKFKFPLTKRLHGVKGIHQAHTEAAKLRDTDMFWVVDADALILDSFNFDYEISTYEKDIVHVWQSQNPVNNLVYGNGGVKLLPRKLTIDMDINTLDLTTSISKRFKSIQEVSNINYFNVDPFTTWRSAFRECCKLASRNIQRQNDKETQQRLDVWCTEGLDKKYGQYAIEGAKLGKAYGLENKDNLEALNKINDFEWLMEKFNASI